MTEKNELAVQNNISTDLGQMKFSSPRMMIETAKEISNDLAGMIRDLDLFSNISGKEYVRVEGWTTLGAMVGVTPRTVSVDEIKEGVFEATVELVRASDGHIIGRGIAECGDSETWRGRDRYARKSMAITRATGKAFRLSYSWIIKMAGFEPTPAEELDNESPWNYTNGNGGNAANVGNPGSVQVPFPKAKKINNGNAPTVAELFDLDPDYCNWVMSNMDGDVVDAMTAFAAAKNQDDIVEGEFEPVGDGPEPTTDFGDLDEIYDAVVNAGLSENAYAARNALTKCRTGYDSKRKAIAWMKLYRGWRDAGSSVEDAAASSNLGETPR